MNWFAGKKILVPWDFSELSRKSLAAAHEMADSHDKILVLHVTAVLSASDPGMVWGTVDDDTRSNRLQQSFEEKAAELAEGVEFHVSFGDPGSEITRFATEAEADCIVIGSHGRTGIEHLLIGSVAERVIRLAGCPVMVMR